MDSSDILQVHFENTLPLKGTLVCFLSGIHVYATKVPLWKHSGSVDRVLGLGLKVDSSRLFM